MKCRKKTIFIISILVSLSCIYQPVFAEDIIPEEAKTEETSEPQPEENDEGISEEESRSDEAVEETPELEEAEIAEEVSGNEDQTVETDEGENLPEDTDTADISTETIIDEQTEENVGEENVNNDDNTEIDTPSEKIDDIRESLKSIDLLKTEKVLQTESSINSGVDYEYADSTDRANKLREFKYIPITFTDKDGLSCGYFYNDGMMLADARDLSVDLALVAANLADAAYSSAVATRLTDMGYSLYHGDTYNYTKEVTYEDNDSVAFAIGHKPIIYGEITYNAYIIAIRGTSKNAEWYSDFNLGKRSDGYHEGFRVAAEDIFNAIRTIQTDNNIFLVTGHSRGAAVANIIAGELSTNSEYRNMVSEDHVFGYTYACPAVSDQLSESDLALRNIYNFNNAGDAIPELPLASWGYKRYGKTLKLETADGQFENLKQRFNTELKEEYAGLLSTTSYLSTISILAKEKQDFYSPTNQLIFDVGAWFLGTKDTGDLVKILLRHNVKGILKYNILKFIGSGIVGELQYHFDNNQKESLELLARVDTELDTTSEYDQEAFDQWITSNSELVKQLKEETEIEIKTRDDLYQARTEIAESMSKLSSFNANLETVLSLWYTSDGDLKNSIFHAHQPQTYVLWINSMFYGYKGWMNNTELEHFDTGEHYFSIGSNCFSNIPNLSDITLRDNAMILGDNAFSGCSQLTKVILPVDMVYTWNGTKDVSPFASDVNIEEIVYKAGKSGEMPDIGKGAVTGAVTVGNDGKLNSLNRIEYIARNAVGKIVYEEGITKISANACSPEFNHYGSDTRVSMEVLKTVDLPSTLEKVGDYAFYGSKITSAYLLRNVKEIGSYAFDGISNLTMYVYRNTYAHQYALTNNKNYVLLDPAATAISLPSEKEMPLGSTEQLTITYTPADATDPIFWVSSDESIVSIDENGNAKALSTGTAIITATTDTGLSAQSVITVSSKGVSVYGTSLALEGKIGINFYLNIAEEELEYLNVVMTMNGQTTTVPASEGKASTVGGQKLRMFVYPVAAKEMRDKVTLTVEDAEGNKIKLAKDETDYTEGYPFSAADYFARAEEAGSEKTKKLARVLNNYGKYAQIYFNHNPEEVTDLTDVSAVTLETLAPYQAVQTENQVAGLTYVGGTTMLDDAIGYRLYFKIDTSHKISDYTFKMDGKVVTPVKSGSQYYIEKTDIAAKDLGVKNKIEVTDGTNTFGIQYCALSYAYRALELTAEDKIPLQNMCRAMYLYNQQAIEYFNS